MPGDWGQEIFAEDEKGSTGLVTCPTETYFQISIDGGEFQFVV